MSLLTRPFKLKAMARTFKKFDSESAVPKNLALMFAIQSKAIAPKTALQFKKDGLYRDISYGEFLQNVRRLALALKKRGVKKNDRVLILSENRPEWFYSDLSALSLGAVTVPIYATSSPKECSYIINDCEGTVLFISSQEQYSRLSDELKSCVRVKHIICFEDLGNGSTEFIGQLLEEGKGLESYQSQSWEKEINHIERDDLATIIYTSGTTGQPKGVMLTHWNLLSNCWSAMRGISLVPEDILLSILPLSHVFERMAGFYLQIYIGTTVAFAENMKTAAQNMLEIRPTMMNAVPRFFEKLYENINIEIEKRGALAKGLFSFSMEVGRKLSHLKRSGRRPPLYLYMAYEFFDFLIFKKIKQKLGGRVRFFVSGGAPLSKELAEYFHAMGILILEGYGLTETSPVISVNRRNRFRFGSVGIPLVNVQVRIADDGEIQVKGPGVMKGYYKNDAATREVIQDGWFLTGDIGHLDSEGFLHITDRKKDLIKTSGGKFVSPLLVESCLTSDDWIQQAFIYGDKKKFIVGLIVPNFSRAEEYAKAQNISFSTKEELIKNPDIKKIFDERILAAQKDLAEYEHVKYYSILPDEMTLESGELTPTLKMKRRVVFEKYKNLIEKMYSNASAS